MTTNQRSITLSINKINELKKMILELDDEINEFVSSSPDGIEMCEVLVALNMLKRDLGDVYDMYAKSVGEAIGSAEVITLPDGSSVEKKSSYDRKGWKHADLGRAVAERLAKMAIDMDTGEVMKSPEEIAGDMLTYCAPSYWRIKELGKIGINPDNYCEVGELKTSIIVRKGKNL